MIYLDNAATTMISDPVRKAMIDYLENHMFGNPDSRHAIGLEANKSVERARGFVANAIGAKPSDIIFTSGGSEANSLAICGLKDPWLFGITDAGEHASVKESFYKLFFRKDIVGLHANGQINYDELEKFLEQENGGCFVSVMAVNNETGAVNDLWRVAEMCKANDALLHVDYVQAFGQYPINVSSFPCDFLSISSHKVHGPQGVGALYVREKSWLKSIINGSETQEFGIRPGTKNVLGIIGFGEACRNIDSCRVDGSLSNQFKKSLYSKLAEYYGDEVYNIVHQNGEGSPKILNLRFDGVDGESLVLMASANGVCISSGSACHASESKPSGVLKSMGLTDEEALGAIRVSFSSMNTIEECKVAGDLTAKCVHELRG